MRNVRKISKKYYLRQIVACWLVSCLFFNTSFVLAAVPPATTTTLPTGESVIYGSVGDFDRTITNELHLRDVAEQTIINWGNFDIGENALTEFHQLGANPAVLNRVLSTDPTGIFGTLKANGDLFIIATGGLVFGPQSYVQARNLVASGIDIRDTDFIAGNFLFEKNDGYPGYSDRIGNVTNEGIGTDPGIHAEQIALLGQNVTNKGIIKTTASGGAVVMAAGESVYLSEIGSNVAVEVVMTEPAEHIVDNGGELGTGAGTITANEGKVILAAGDIYSAAIEGVESLRAEAKRDITLEGAVSATGDITLAAVHNVDLPANKTVTTNGNLTIEATDGEIMAETSVIDMAADGKTLSLKQNEGMDLEQDFFVDNRINTNLIADSTGGSVVSDAAGEWGSITAYAADNITLSDISEVITTGTLEADIGDVKVTSIDGKVEVYGPVSAGQDVIITATNEGLDGSDDAIFLDGEIDEVFVPVHVEAGGDIWLNNNTWAADGVSLHAGQDVRIGWQGDQSPWDPADGYYAPKTLTGAGALTVEADRDITLGGDVTVSTEISGDLILKADADTVNEEPEAEAGGDMTAYGTIDNPGGDIDIYAADSTIYLWDDVTALDAIILHNNTVVKAAGKKLDSVEDDVVLAADKTLESDYDLTINAGDDILLGLTDADQHWINQDVGSGGDVTANGGDLILNAGDEIYAHGSLTSTGGSDVDITAVYDITLYGPVTAEDNIYITAVSGDDAGWLLAYDSLTANAGEIDVLTDWYIDLRGPVYAYTDLTLNANTDFENDGYIVAEDTLTAETGNILGKADDQIRFDDVAKAGGNITLDADSDDILSDYDDLTVNGLVAGGYIDLSAGDSTININKSADSLATADVDAGSDIILHANTEVADGVKLDAGQDIHLDDHKTLNGAGTFTLEANRDIYLGGDTTAGTGGSGNLYLTSDADGTDGGIVEAKGNIVAADDAAISGNVLLTGADGIATHNNQKIEATAGKLIVDGDVDKTSAGNLDMFGGFNGPLGSGDYSVSTKAVSSQEGDLTIAGNAFVLLDGDIYSKGRMELTSNADGVEIGVDAGTLEHASGTVKSLNDDVDMAAINSRILLNGGVAYDPANPSTTTYVSAGGDILLYSSTSIAADRNLDAGDDVALAADKRIIGNGSLTIEAGDDILLGIDDVATHWLNQDIGTAGNVTANGDLTLTAGDDIHAHGQLLTQTDSAGNITATAVDNIHLYNTPTSADADGTLTLTADSDDGVGGDGGDLTVDGALYGNMSLSGVDVTVYGDVESDGILDVDADDDIVLQANVSSVGEMTMDAGSDIELNSSSGDTSSESTISLNAGDSVTIGIAFGDNGDVTANGSMDIFAGTDSVDNVTVFGKLTTTNGGNIDVTAGGDIKLGGSFVDSVYEYESAQADGDLTLDAEDNLVVLGDLISNNGSIELSSDNTTTYLGGDVTAAIDVTLNNNTKFYGFGDQKVDAQTGKITAKGWLWKASCWGSLYLEAADDVSLADYVKAYGGGVSIISEEGKIFTPDEYGYETDTLNVEITGYSDQLEGDGVSLPLDPDKKAAIVIISKEDLKLGPDSQLIANGYYLPLHAIDLDGIDSFEELSTYWNELYNEFGGVIDDLKYGFEAYLSGLEVDPEDFSVYKELLGNYLNSLDDRPAIDFLAEPSTAIGGIIRDEGEPIDVAVYLQSETGDVDVESQLISVNDNGTMVVDAYDTVTLGDLTSEPAIQTVESVEVPDGRSWVIDRLEVASRLTEWLFEADAFGTLPHPYNPEIVEAFIGGEYVLRGAGLGNPAILDGRAWILEDPLDPAPLYEEAGEAADKEEFEEGGCPPLMDWLANEIGIPAEDIHVTLAGALALNTDVQPCEMCARLMDSATTLEDAEGTRIAAMARVVNEYVTTPAPPSPEQMTQIAAALSEHAGDGTYYALAGKWIDALVAYVGIMNTEMGYSASDAAAFAKKYLTPVTDTGNVALNAYVQARLAALGG